MPPQPARRKTAVIVLLTIWFLWATGKDLDALARYFVATDYYILSTSGLAWLYFVMCGITFLLDAASVFYLFRPAPVGIRVLFSALAANLIQSVVSLSLAMDRIPEVREAYARSRELRGLSVREDALDMIFTPRSLLISAGVLAGIMVLVAFAVYRARPHFLGGSETVAEL